MLTLAASGTNSGSTVSDGSPAPRQATPLGALLVSRGFLSDEQLTDALAVQAETGRPLGTILVEGGVVRAAVVAQALATQHGSILKTEYGFATGFDARIADETSAEPPVSPNRAALATTLRLGGDAAASPAPRIESAAAPLEEIRGPASMSRLEAVELELAGVTAENVKLRSRLGEIQLDAARMRAESEASRQEAAIVSAREAGLTAAIAALQEERVSLQAQVAELQRRAG
jgi:hypothetical protein